MNFTYRLIRDADRTTTRNGKIELRIAYLFALPLLTPAACAAPLQIMNCREED